LNAKPLLVPNPGGDLEAHHYGGYMGQQCLDVPICTANFSVESDREVVAG